MADDTTHSELPHGGSVELTRVQPMEAEAIAARLRASGIPATVGPGSPYESIEFADGVSVMVPAADVEHARAVMGS